jgi:hypothetical protein
MNMSLTPQQIAQMKAAEQRAYLTLKNKQAALEQLRIIQLILAQKPTS